MLKNPVFQSAKVPKQSKVTHRIRLIAAGYMVILLVGIVQRKLFGPARFRAEAYLRIGGLNLSRSGSFCPLPRELHRIPLKPSYFGRGIAIAWKRRDEC